MSLHTFAENSDLNKRRKHKSRASYRQTAKHIVASTKSSEEKGIKRNEKQEKAYSWAVKFLKEDEVYIQSLKETNAVKRDRSLNESFVDPKRHKLISEVKNIDGMPLSDIVKQHLKVCVVDTASVDWRISVENFGLIEKSIMDSIMQILDDTDSDPPGYEMNERYHGFRLILCETQFSLDFLHKCISNLSPPWEGAKIEVKSLWDLPAPRKIRIIIPDLDLRKDQILKVLTRSNRNVPISNWKLIHIGEAIRGRKLLLFRSDDVNLEALEAQGNKIKFSLRKITVWVSSNRSFRKELEEGHLFDEDMDFEISENCKELDAIEELEELSRSLSSNSLNSTVIEANLPPSALEDVSKPMES